MTACKTQSPACIPSSCSIEEKSNVFRCSPGCPLFSTQSICPVQIAGMSTAMLVLWIKVPSLFLSVSFCGTAFLEMLMGISQVIVGAGFPVAEQLSTSFLIFCSRRTLDCCADVNSNTPAWTIGNHDFRFFLFYYFDFLKSDDTPKSNSSPVTVRHICFLLDPSG